ncbi:tetratricopeptide repeat protein [Nostoc sp. CALU 1950]|uniref:tetratricopeptide repeat protein n=1 Tax=Nostoc sp. CALU 1950 TaxID=3104321 RepID=UPI003EB6AE89
MTAAINTDKEYQDRLKHFTSLKSKYQATKYKDSSPSSLLYLILRKVDLGIELTTLEIEWLKEHDLEFICQEQQDKLKDFVKLGVEFSKLKSKYKATKHGVSWQSSHLYFMLWKLESGNLLTDSEVQWLRANGLYETNKISQEIKQFTQVKSKYKATQSQDSYPDSLLEQILKKLELAERLSNYEYNWLINNKLFETAEVFQQKESLKETHFAQLREKYQANLNSGLSLSSPLYPILQNIDANKNLRESEINWLEQQGLSQTITIGQELEQTREFSALRVKYKVTHYEDLSPKSHLYKVLKRLDLSNQLGEQDINFLKKRKLTKIIEIANEKYANTLKLNIESGETLNESEIDWLKNNGRENIIILAQQKHFAALKSKYDVLGYQDKSQTSFLYTILQKLELKERLEPTDFAWLQETKIKVLQPTYSYYTWQKEPKYQEKNLVSGKIWIAYHTIEANFYEQEFQRTDNKWNLANASSHWRKADKPEQALQLTNNLEFDKIKENKLKSALLTSRGGAFRDIEKLDNAENCARQAIEYQPKSHHPYTLMGAICFERHQYSDGEYWFQEAIKCGANPRDMDSEIKRVVKNAKDENKRRKVIEYLLKKDSQRYAWAKSYLNKSSDNGK